jgi:hypothetical protein
MLAGITDHFMKHQDQCAANNFDDDKMATGERPRVIGREYGQTQAREAAYAVFSAVGIRGQCSSRRRATVGVVTDARLTLQRARRRGSGKGSVRAKDRV